MSASPNLRPSLATPPPPPAFRLPRERRRGWGGALVSFAIHATIVSLAVWPARKLLEAGGGGRGPGPQGGGGGGGREISGFVALEPLASSPPAVTEPAPPPVQVEDIPLPEMMPVEDLARVDIPTGSAAVVGAGAGAGGGPGSGTGTGGGQGPGRGTGVGPGEGPGSGGDGSYIRAQPRGVILPPECAKGARFLVRFWVGADGRVTEIDVQPQPREGSCRSDFEARMRAYRFEPARTRDGVAVASIFPITIER